jgi:hypothetical protein
VTQTYSVSEWRLYPRRGRETIPLRETSLYCKQYLKTQTINFAECTALADPLGTTCYPPVEKDCITVRFAFRKEGL